MFTVTPSPPPRLDRLLQLTEEAVSTGGVSPRDTLTLLGNGTRVTHPLFEGVPFTGPPFQKLSVSLGPPFKTEVITKTETRTVLSLRPLTVHARTEVEVTHLLFG